jgi:hypothetical protein
MAGQPNPVPDVHHEGRNHQAPDDEGVEEHPERDGEPDLREYQMRGPHEIGVS